MKRFDYNFSEYQSEYNKIAKKILKESYEDEYNAQDVSDQIDEAQATYNKIQKILNAPEMIKCHSYLYALDQENVDECDRQKVDKLYELGKARGVIQEDDDDFGDDDKHEDDEHEDDEDCGELCGGPQDALTGQEMVPGEQKPAMGSAAFTVLYSAMKDGQIKTGEYFSSATDQDAAKADCIDNLSPLGYSSIRVLGIEQANPAVDMAGSDLDGFGGLAEDDSQEYENQETGAGEETADTGKEDDAGDTEAEKTEKEPESKDDKPAEEKDEKDQASDGEEPKNDGKDDSEENPEDKPEDKEEEPKDAEDGEEEKKKLTPTEKQVLRDEYVGMFKSELQKTKLEKSVEEMGIKEKADFWSTISKKWTKEDPEEFMSDKEIEKLNNTVIKNS